MPNDVLRAIDAVLVLAVEDASTPEGKAADALVSQYDLSNVVGRLTNVSITDGTAISRNYDDANRLTGATGASLAYDAAGRRWSTRGRGTGDRRRSWCRGRSPTCTTRPRGCRTCLPRPACARQCSSATATAHRSRSLRQVAATWRRALSS